MIICLFLILATSITQTLALKLPDHPLGKEYSAKHQNRRTEHVSRLEPLSHVNTTRLQVAYYEDGSSDSRPFFSFTGDPMIFTATRKSRQLL
jgi:hypothetical protein